MQNEIDDPVRSTVGSNKSPSREFSWRAAFLGASVGIAGPAYFGTLAANLTLWVWIAQGQTLQAAYAQLFQYKFTFVVVMHLVADACFAFASGWVSAAYGRGAALVQGVAAGLLSASFPLVMWLSPNPGEMPLLFRALSLGIPILGGVVGGLAHARKT